MTLRRRAWLLWVAWVGLGGSLAHAALETGTGYSVVVAGDDLLRQLENPTVSTIYLLGNMTLSASVWVAKAVEVNRSVTITVQFPQLSNTVIDSTLADWGSISCSLPACKILVQGPGITFINGNVTAGYDFATPVPQIFYIGDDGQITLDTVTVISPLATAMWNNSNVIYQPQSSWWVGDLRYSCLSSTEIVIDHWVSYVRDWSKAVGAPTWASMQGALNLTNVRMALSRQFVCQSFNQEQCQAVQKVCAYNRSSRQLSIDACTPQQVKAACRPLTSPPSPVRAPGAEDPATFNPALTVPTVPTALPTDKGGGLWWVGVLVGVVVAIVLVGAVGGWLWQRRQRLIQKPAPPAAHNASTTEGKTDGSPSVIVKGDSQPRVSKCDSGGAATSSSSPSTDDPLGPSALGDPPSGATLSQHSSPMWGKAEVSRTSFGFQADVDPLLNTIASSLTAVGGNASLTQHTVVIDMVPPSPGNAVPQLARNPLGVTLQSVLGTGAYGTVYQATWNGQEVAVKVLRHQVTDVEELEAILAVKEAALGSELCHPRIVRTLAHALMVPEGLLDEEGQLARPGMVEVHIVSSLCDKGTLKAWLQQARAATGAPSVASTLGGLATVRPSGSGKLLPNHSRLQLITPPSAGAAPNSVRSPGQADSGETTPRSSPPVLSDAPDSTAPSRAAQPDAPLSEPCLGQATGRASLPAVPVGAGLPPASGDPSPGSKGRSRLSLSGVRPTGEPLGAGKWDALLGPGGSTLQVSPRSAHEPSSGALALYPPLVCMPSWGDTGLGLHKDLTCHMVAVVDILLEVADGLSYLLSKGVVHGDLKPQNCLCCSDPNSLRGFSIQICDFGISRVLHGSKSHTTVSTPPGTLAYFAPELLSTCHLSPACDLYSFGIIMYELVTCRQPLGNLTMAQILYKKATGKVNEHLVFPTETPPAYVALAHACFSVEASARPSLAEVQAQLLGIREQLLTHWPLQQPPPPPPKTSSLFASNESLSCAQ